MVKKIKRQITLPSISMGVMETSIFSAVFLLIGTQALHKGTLAMLLPMFIFVVVMMLSMVLTGVYRSDISRSVVRLYQRTAVGYLIAGLSLVLLAAASNWEFLELKLTGVALLVSYFVVSTIRPVISDSLAAHAGDRRNRA